MARLESGWQRLISEIGVEFLDDRSLDLFRAAGQRVDGSVVRLDPEFVLEMVARVPSRFVVQGRNRDRDLVFEPDRMIFAPTQGSPFVSEGSVRRGATFEDFVRFVRLTHMVDELDTPGYPVCEATDRPPRTRHLDMQFALATETDKPYAAAPFDGIAAADSVEMAAILHGGRDAIAEAPGVYGVINVNSPMRYDTPMLDALFALVDARQPVALTPFILMGAMGPVSLAAALAQQCAEALAGIALVQWAAPGCPAMLGSFVSHSDMQSGAPGFGARESALGLLASGQLARRYGLLWRAGGGGLTSSPAVDAQASFESLNTMFPAFLAGANLVLHAAGWLESGLVASYEKFMIDVEALHILQDEFTPFEVGEDELAFSAHEEVGHGGHFFGTQHTLERFRDCFYRPRVFTTENFSRWQGNGGLTADVRATKVWHNLLDAYEQPTLDEALREELGEFVSRRKRELPEE